MTAPVVHCTRIEPSIIQITLEDRANKNTFSPGFCRDLAAAFRDVAAEPACKAVVLTGYDTYFCSGGTREGLLELSEGGSKFTDTPIYNLPLKCEVPVIAAMQGHGIGGGFVLGLFADLVVLSRESIYTTNFMKYGFTPGFGSTLVLREKLGLALAQEMLMGAGTHRGADLAQRGIPFPVLPRQEVLPHAIEQARQLAEKPRDSLRILKDHLVGDLRSRLPAITEQEVAMHAQTFHQDEVRERIRTLFGN